MTGFSARAERYELAVDNFFTEKNINDFNAQTPKCVESMFFRDFSWITHALCG